MSDQLAGSSANGGSGEARDGYERIKVLVETTERSFRGHVYKRKSERFRLSDHLNTYDKQFLCLTEVMITDRGKEYRIGDKRDFVAISIASITFVTPMGEDET
jgi:hypothetical protein